MIYNKIKSFIQEQSENYSKMKEEFGSSFALKTIFYSSVWRVFDIKSDLYINSNLKLLKNEFCDLIDRYNNTPTNNSETQESKIIWVCWWQGLDSMPDFCRLCYNHLVNNTSPDYQVIIVTENNYLNYVSLPPHIVDKYNKGIIKIQQFSDILRQALLWQVGGVWMDATLFTLPGYLDYIDTGKEFWSVNLGRVVKRRQLGQILTNCQWSSFLQVGKKNNIVNRFVYEAMVEYYTRHTHTIDYFLQNYLLRIAKENIKKASEVFDQINISNPHLYDLSLCIDDPFNKVKWDSMCSDTRIFKLTYKVPYSEINGDAPTFYSYIKNLEL